MTRTWWLLLVAAAGGCNEYHAGSFTSIRDRWPGERVALPCFDVAVAAHREPGVDGPVVRYSFGNRCEHDATLDLAAAHVVARDVDGREQALDVVDPGGELHAVAVPARVWGSEQLSYAPARGAAVAQLCVDVGALERAGDAAPRWLCSALEGAR
nr:hypothetical protein [Kofleriaceae bacterium]